MDLFATRILKCREVFPGIERKKSIKQFYGRIITFFQNVDSFYPFFVKYTYITIVLLRVLGRIFM